VRDVYGKKIILVCLLVFLSAMPLSSATTYQCDSCSSCSDILVNASVGDTVLLNASISNVTGDCIVMDSISGVTFDGGGYSVSSITGGGSGIYVPSSSNVTVQNCTVISFNNGILSYAGSYVRIRDMNASGNSYGFSIVATNHINLTSVNATGNVIGFNFVVDNSFINMSGFISDSNTYGIFMDSSTLGGNVIQDGVVVSNADGFLIQNTQNFTVRNVNATLNSQYGIYIYGNSIYNDFDSMIISDNTNGGIRLDNNAGNSYGNIIHNSILNNTYNVIFDDDTVGQVWNTADTLGANIIGGSHSGGNFWAFPNGSGYSDTCLGYHFCNAPYVMSANNTDYLPLLVETINLQCFASPSSVGAGDSFTNACNLTYMGNSSVIDDANCVAHINKSIIVRRYFLIDTEEALYGSNYGGFGMLLPTNIVGIGGGALMRCTNQTTGNLTIYQFVSNVLPFANLNDTDNITSINYTIFYGSYSCDMLDSLFGIKGSVLKPLMLPANMTIINSDISKLGSPPAAYFGFFATCPTCAGGNDSFFIGVNSNNYGYTYHGTLSQTANWNSSVEHAHWLYIDVPSLPMAFNGTSQLYELPYLTSVWSVPANFTAYGNCSWNGIDEMVESYAFEIISSPAPTCGITDYSQFVAYGSNITFTWSSAGVPPFVVKKVEILNGSDVLFLEHNEGTYSFLVAALGNYTIKCSISNPMGGYNSSANVMVGQTGYQLALYYDPFVQRNLGTVIYAIILLNGISVNPVPNVTISIDGATANMTWVANDSAYEVIWIPTDDGEYPFDVFSYSFSPLLNESGLITVLDMFNITVHLWTNVTMTPESKYKNEFAWVIAVRDVDSHFAGLWGRDTFECVPQGVPECYWHGKYVNGTATIYLPDDGFSGNYSLFMIGNNVEFRQVVGTVTFIGCENCKPSVIKQTMNLPLGNYKFSGDETLDLYFNPSEMAATGGFLGWLTAPLGLIVLGGCAILFFFIVLIATGSLTGALAALVLLPTIIMIFIGVIMGGL